MDKSLDVFADALIHLANRSYPGMDVKQCKELVCDRFVAGVANEDVQDAFVQTTPETLKEVRNTVKQIEAAYAMCRRIREKRMAVPATTSGANIAVVSTNTDGQQGETTSVNVTHDTLVEVIRQNTETLERLMAQLPHNSGTSTVPQPARHRSPGPCWQRGKQGHLRRNCPSAVRPLGNEQ